MTGTKLGPFALLEKLGEGGMGVVYKAKDTRLDRFVAIKLLPESLAADPGRRARFIQEARAASALNHPNIVTIHDIAAHEGRHFIVMEYLDGKPLQDLIPKQGMRLADALRAAVQIADALSAAHAANIVHRDLKPGNIMIDAQGRAKVLDFGLAKLAAPATLTEQDETRTMALDAARTEAGTIVGSVPYMSPEQAEGRAVDARSDIFSFGAVLYEMVTGKRAFQGDSRIATLAAVVQRDPTPVSEVAPGVPPELERVISRCLRKDVARRSQHMPDVKLALEELRDESASGKLVRQSATAPGLAAAPAPSGRRWLWPVIAGVCALTAAGAVGWNLLRRGPAASAPAQLVRVTPDDGYSYTEPALSPDGKFVASISDRGGSRQVWLQQVGGNDPIQVTHAARGVQWVEFFPDGKRLLVTTEQDPDSQHTIEVTPMLGGAARLLVRVNIHGVAKLSPDGKLVAYFEHPSPISPIRLVLIPAEGGSPRTLEKWSLTQGILPFTACTWMPDGRNLLVSGFLKRDSRTLDDAEGHILPIDGGDPAATGAGPALRAAGLAGFGGGVVLLEDQFLFAGVKDGRRNVWRIRFDPARRRVVGAPEQLTHGTEDESPASRSAAGPVAIQSSKTLGDIYFLPTDPVTGQASGPTRRLTQDGRMKLVWPVGGDPGSVYFRSFVPGGKTTFDGFALDLANGQQRQLLDSSVELATIPIISFDGRQISYSRADGDTFSISIGEVGAPLTTARPLCQQCGRAVGFSRDGRYLLLDYRQPVKQRDPTFRGRVYLLEVATGKLTPWLEDDTESVTNGGLFGGEWVRVFSDRGGDQKTRRQYLVPWRTTPVPRSEWIQIKLHNISQINRTAPFAYGREGDRLIGMRFDARQRRFTEPFSVRFPAGTVEIRPNDHFWTRGAGIAFLHEDTHGAVWLMKTPE